MQTHALQQTMLLMDDLAGAGKQLRRRLKVRGLCGPFPLISCVRIVSIGIEELLTVDFVFRDCLLSLG